MLLDADNWCPISRHQSQAFMYSSCSHEPYLELTRHSERCLIVRGKKEGIITNASSDIKKAKEMEA
jgi:hypothetical protein